MIRVKVLELRESFKKYETRPIVGAPEKVVELLTSFMPEDKEVFILVSLNTKNAVTAIRTISVGCLNSNIVHPREVFRAAMLDNAAHIIVAHNHPSGDPTPSREDIEITKKLKETGDIIGIPLLDHVIIGNGSGRHFSLKEAGHF